MATSKTYTERIAVRIPAQQRDEIDAKLGDVGLSAALRDATLRVIDRADLILAPWRDNAHKQRWSGDGDDDFSRTLPDDEREELLRERAEHPKSRWAVIPVPLTSQQKKAIEHAAQKKGQATSKLMLDALMFELGMQGADQRGWRKGWPVGRRKSDAPTYTPAQKARLVAYAEKHGVAATSEKHGISRATLFTWKRAKKKAAKKKR